MDSIDALMFFQVSFSRTAHVVVMFSFALSPEVPGARGSTEGLRSPHRGTVSLKRVNGRNGEESGEQGVGWEVLEKYVGWVLQYDVSISFCNRIYVFLQGDLWFFERFDVGSCFLSCLVWL